MLQLDEVDEGAVSQIVDMGYERGDVVAALQASDNDRVKAVELLIGREFPSEIYRTEVVTPPPRILLPLPPPPPRIFLSPSPPLSRKFPRSPPFCFGKKSEPFSGQLDRLCRPHLQYSEPDFRLQIPHLAISPGCSREKTYLSPLANVYTFPFSNGPTTNMSGSSRNLSKQSGKKVKRKIPSPICLAPPKKLEKRASPSTSRPGCSSLIAALNRIADQSNRDSAARPNHSGNDPQPVMAMEHHRAGSQAAHSSQEQDSSIAFIEKGELLPNSSSPNKFTWTFYSFEIPTYGDCLIVSPTFRFATSKWHFSMYPAKCRDSEAFGLSVVLEDSDKSHRVHWILRIEYMKCSGKSFKKCEGVVTFDHDNLAAHALQVTFSETEKEFHLVDILIVTCELYLVENEAGAAVSCNTDQISSMETLSRHYMELLLSRSNSDTTIRVKETEFKVHRAILGVRSPVFSSMFAYDMLEKSSGVVDIKDCEPDVFRMFLNFVYSGQVKDVPPDKMVDLYKVADKYQVDDLKSSCLEIIRGGLSVQSFCKIVTLALEHTETGLLASATDFFTRNISDIIVTVEWQNFLKHHHVYANELLIKSFGA